MGGMSGLFGRSQQQPQGNPNYGSQMGQGGYGYQPSRFGGYNQASYQPFGNWGAMFGGYSGGNQFFGPGSYSSPGSMPYGGGSGMFGGGSYGGQVAPPGTGGIRAPQPGRMYAGGSPGFYANQGQMMGQPMQPTNYNQMAWNMAGIPSQGMGGGGKGMGGRGGYPAPYRSIDPPPPPQPVRPAWMTNRDEHGNFLGGG